MRQAVDIEAAGKLLGLSYWQTYGLLKRRHDPLPGKKLGKQWRIDVEQLWRWFDRQGGTASDDLEGFI